NPDVSAKPGAWALHPLYPNPFNNSATLRFSLPKRDQIALDLFDIQGKQVTSITSGVYTAGDHSLPFEMPNLASGIYFIRMSTSYSTSIQKAVLLK
ncbi:MAG: T9SS type A sorting domain-containing protein, partial [bacterium]